MGVQGQLRGVEHELLKDLRETTGSVSQLAKKYGVSRQSIYGFIGRRGVKRPARKHTRQCSICQGLIRIASKRHSDFISSHTMKTQLGLERKEFSYHVGVLRRRGLVSQKFGRLRSQKVERAYQIYFTKRLPIGTIGRLVGLKGLSSRIRKHKDSGWDVPAPLFTYDSNERSKSHLKGARRKRGR